jgi:hypothetical protein
MTTETETQLVPTDPLDLPPETVVKNKLAQVKAFQGLIQSTLIEGHDYGTIPGTNKPTLLKPGAEKITKLVGCADTYEEIHVIRDWDRPLFAYEIKCQLISLATGQVVAEGLGECNSYEAKYRWRQAERTCPTCQEEGAVIKGKAQYGGGWLCWQKKGGCGAKFLDGDPQIESQSVDRIENPDVFDQVNTFLKMAKKRALVDAALSVGRLSDLFTQDLEDRPQEAKTKPAAEKPEKPQETAVRPPGSPPGPVQQAAKLVVPDEMTGTDFVNACKAVGWDQDRVAERLGTGLQEWMRKNSVTSYRFAWNACIQAEEDTDGERPANGGGHV